MVKKTLLILLLVTSTLLAACNPVENGVASVNQEIISFEEFELYDRMLNKNQRRLSKKETLDKLILVKVALQEANRLKLTVSDTELENAFNDATKHFPELSSIIKEEGEIDNLKKSMKNVLTLQKLKNAKVDQNKIKVSKEELESQFKNEPLNIRSEKIRLEKQNKLFDEWVLVKKKQSDIVINKSYLKD